MEDEVDVDIEGDDFDRNLNEIDGGAGLQLGFTQATGKGSSWMLPWELDTSISPENREVIERMLLEEQYYLTGKGIPDQILHNDAQKKPKTKKSSTKSSASATSRWSKQEKELFEKGVAQFGRRWTKIAKLVGSRTVLQVKSYGRQYFKHKTKSEPEATASPTVAEQPPQPTATWTNAIRIERLSDDEDVDITDDLSEDERANEKTLLIKTERQPEDEIQPEEANRDGTETIHDTKQETSFVLKPNPQLSSLVSSEEFETRRPEESATASNSPESPHTHEQKYSKTSDEINQNPQCDITMQMGHPDEGHNDCKDFTDKIEADGPERDPEEQEDDEEEELKAPDQEIELDMETITEDEKQAIPEFFEGRSSKTPERYLKIRNYILDQWLKSRPKYLNKTSVRPGLKNCGDVNCIGRIHTYLELIGAINFNCEQAVYNRPRVVDRSKFKEGKEVLEAYQLAQRLQSMRTRKRRVRDFWGNWCDPKDLEGQTFEHLSAKEMALRREEMKTQAKPCKMSRFRGSIDPFQLIPCRSFAEDIQEPFQVIVCAETLLIMDMHAHVSQGEVIGLLGGTFNEEAKVLKICAAEPCNSVSTGLQCEMDPVSQTQACDVLSSLGLNVVGWYHSHPSFHPNPSVRDISTQDQFQSYFSRGGAPFIGMIVSPYDPANASPLSQITCLLVKESQEPSGLQKLPYRFDFLSSQATPDWEQTMRRAQWIIHKYAQVPGNVQMNKLYRRDSHLTCLEKMLSSMARYLEPISNEGDSFLTQIQSLFWSDFISNQQSSEKEDEELPVNSADEMIDQEEPQEEKGVKENNSSMVLHLGSVLSAEHDYLV